MRIPPETGRLRFRAYRAEDAARVEAMFDDPYARRFFPHMARAGAPAVYVERQRQRYLEHGHGLWVIERKADGVFVGDCGLTYQRAGEGQVLEVGYHVIATQRRQGFASEAALACRDHAFEELGARFVASIVDPDNEASRSVAQRVHREMRWFERDAVTLCLYFTDRP